MRGGGPSPRFIQALKGTLGPVERGSRDLPWAENGRGGQPWLADRMVRVENEDRTFADTSRGIVVVDLHNLDADLAESAALSVVSVTSSHTESPGRVRLVVGKGNTLRGGA